MSTGLLVVALVGDLLAWEILIGAIALTGRPIRPPFEDDPQMAARELNRMVQGGARCFYLGHGAPLEASAVISHVRHLEKIGWADAGAVGGSSNPAALSP